jgi:hypothetical protein
VIENLPVAHEHAVGAPERLKAGFREFVDGEPLKLHEAPLEV